MNTLNIHLLAAELAHMVLNPPNAGECVPNLETVIANKLRGLVAGIEADRDAWKKLAYEALPIIEDLSRQLTLAQKGQDASAETMKGLALKLAAKDAIIEQRTNEANLAAKLAEDCDQRLKDSNKANDQLRAQLTAATQRAEKADEFRERAAEERRFAQECLCECKATMASLIADKDQAEAALKEESDKLTHVLTSLEEGSLPWWQNKHDELLAKWFKAEAACAEMRRALEDAPCICQELSMRNAERTTCRRCTALSSDYGNGHVSKEELKPTIEVLRQMGKGFGTATPTGHEISKEIERLQALVEKGAR